MMKKNHNDHENLRQKKSRYHFPKIPAIQKYISTIEVIFLISTFD